MVAADGTEHRAGHGSSPLALGCACAAALAVRTWFAAGAEGPVPDVWEVEVPGGLVRVRLLEGGHVELAGPAELVFSGETEV